MPTPMRPWTKAALAKLEGGPTPREELLAEMSLFIPEGAAMRQREYEAERLRRTNDVGGAEGAPATPTSRPRRSVAHVIKVGRRRVASKTLGNLVRRGLVVRDVDIYRLP